MIGGAKHQGVHQFNEWAEDRPETILSSMTQLRVFCPQAFRDYQDYVGSGYIDTPTADAYIATLSTIDTSICQASRQIREEAHEVLYGRNTLTFLSLNQALGYMILAYRTQIQQNLEFSTLAFTKSILIHLRFRYLVDDEKYASSLGKLMQLLPTFSPRLASVSLTGCRDNFPNLLREVPNVNWDLRSLHEAYEFQANLEGGNGDIGPVWAMIRNMNRTTILGGTNPKPLTTKLLFGLGFRSRIERYDESSRRLLAIYGTMRAVVMQSWNKILGGELYVDGILCYKDGIEMEYPFPLDYNPPIVVDLDDEDDEDDDEDYDEEFSNEIVQVTADEDETRTWVDPQIPHDASITANDNSKYTWKEEDLLVDL